MKNSVTHLPIDVLHRTFTLSIPTSFPPPTKDNDIADFYSSTSPHNISLVCRSWRDLTLSSPSMWSTFFFSFSDPSDRTLDALYNVTDRHLRRSRDTPLTCFMRLSGTYRKSLSSKIVTAISKHQGRWKRVGFCFNVRGEPYNVLSHWDEDASYIRYYVPVPVTYLHIADLQHLEELRLTFSSEYIPKTEFDDKRTPLHTLPSLKLLDLEMMHSRHKEAIHWLLLASNIEELNILNAPKYKISYVPKPGRAYEDFGELPHIHLANLRTFRAGSPASDDPNEKNALPTLILAHTTCPALMELDLSLNSIWCENVLYNFLLRSAPPNLGILHLNIVIRCHAYIGGQRQRVLHPERIFDALALIPTVREFSLRWPDLDAVHIMQELMRKSNQANPSSPHALFPALEHLELVRIHATVAQWGDLIASRWKAQNRTLKHVKLSHCHFEGGEVDVPDVGRTRWHGFLPEFRNGEDPSQLPDEIRALKDFVKEGLLLEVPKYEEAKESDYRQIKDPQASV